MMLVEVQPRKHVLVWRRTKRLLLGRNGEIELTILGIGRCKRIKVIFCPASYSAGRAELSKRRPWRRSELWSPDWSQNSRQCH
jgi:hypothetical protein